jgi:hypothetical protein
VTLDARQRLVRRLAALGEPGQRVAVLSEEAQRLGMGAFADLAAVLVSRASETRAEPDRIALATVMELIDSDLLDDTDRMALLEACRDAGHQQLMRLLVTPPGQRASDAPRVPDYGKGRTLTLGERKSMARRPNRKVLEQVLTDPHPAVIRNLLRNPKLTELDVLRLAARRPNQADVLREIYKDRKWSARYRVKLALARNPYASPDMVLKILPQLMRQDLDEMLDDRNLHPSVLVSCRRLLLGEDAPLPSDDGDSTVH